MERIQRFHPHEPHGPVRRLLTASLALLLCVLPQVCLAQPPLDGVWTGGFLLKGNWVAVNLRFTSPGDTLRDNGDILFPSYGGGENVLNVPLENLKKAPTALHVEIPARTGRVLFDGAVSRRTKRRSPEPSFTGP